MPSASAALDRLVTLNQRLEHAEQQRDEAMRRRDAGVREALAQGNTWAAITAATGLSSQTIKKARERA